MPDLPRNWKHIKVRVFQIGTIFPYLFFILFFFPDLNMDFESEFADFLSRDVPNPESRVRRGSNTIVANNTNERLEYNIDGTINCSDLNYTTLVSIIYVTFCSLIWNTPR